MIIHYIAAFLSLLLSVVAQILLKIGANRSVGKSAMSLFLNFYTFSGVMLFLAATVFSLFALRGIDLKEMVFITPMAFILIPVFSRIILKEEISKRRMFSGLIVVVGVLVFNLGKIL